MLLVTVRCDGFSGRRFGLIGRFGLRENESGFRSALNEIGGALRSLLRLLTLGLCSGRIYFSTKGKEGRACGALVYACLEPLSS